jgi:hypothetical protein
MTEYLSHRIYESVRKQDCKMKMTGLGQIGRACFSKTRLLSSRQRSIHVLRGAVVDKDQSMDK